MAFIPATCGEWVGPFRSADEFASGERGLWFVLCDVLQVPYSPLDGRS